MDHHAELAQAAQARALAELQFHRADERYKALMAVAVRSEAAPATSMARDTLNRVLAARPSEPPAVSAGIAGAPLAKPALELVTERHAEVQFADDPGEPEPQSDMERMVAAIQGSVKLATT